jgi:peroxiredoxin
LTLMRTFIATLLLGALTLTGQSLSGRRAPSFSLPDSNNVQHDILDYRGKWLLLVFASSTGCSHCAPLSRELEKIQGTKISILTIMLPPENYTTGARYAAENKITSPIVFDQSQVAIGYFKATPANPRIDTPHMFAISPNGMIVQDWPDGAVGNMLAAKGGVAAAVQSAMAAAPK